jgi:hypothetical protein
MRYHTKDLNAIESMMFEVLDGSDVINRFGKTLW